MLKATLKIYDYIDIGMYQQLIGFLKSKAKGYKPNAKAKVFSQNEIHEFIDNAPDELWLDLKVMQSRNVSQNSVLKWNGCFRLLA